MASRWRTWAAGGILALMVGLSSLVAADRLLYLASPWLPTSLDQALSPHAKLRRLQLRPEAQPWIYATHIRYGRPGATIDGHTVDGLGYRNPPATTAAPLQANVLLLGDSFTWGTEDQTIADYLRQDLAPARVYSVGVLGEGIPQWRYHYQRFMGHARAAPPVVVLNFYSGNDVRDTQHWLEIQDQMGEVPSAVFFSYLASAEDRAELGASWLHRHARLQELRYLAEHARDNLAPVDDPELQPAVLAPGLPSSTFYIRHEPDPAAVTPRILGEMRACIGQIRHANPASVILLAYIPTTGALYGSRILHCPSCDRDVERQVRISAQLAHLAADQHVNYLDATPQLRRDAATGPVWHDTHFNPRGYALYAQYLAGAIAAAAPELPKRSPGG